jgi:hypothetical protein
MEAELKKIADELQKMNLQLGILIKSQVKTNKEFAAHWTPDLADKLAGMDYQNKIYQPNKPEEIKIGSNGDTKQSEK